MKIYGYCRISDVSQNENRQLDAMAKLKIPQTRIYVDKQSGKDFIRPAWQAMVKKLEAGDMLYVGSIDRLGRSYADILDWWRILTKEKGVDIVVMDMPLLDTRKGRDLLGTLIADLVISLFGYVAEKERTDIRTRQRAGINAAKARGVHLGRPIKRPPEDFAAVVKQWEQGKIPFDDALVQTGLKRATFYNRLREMRVEKKK
ncbi:MAG: recombinase family protein [Defluviitaleaceae bacterium]|nr:recombinase family protein [Defluviitaleaceae bacterium]MCL2239522.1 recombinase family protein [Defluviitaleaceae bacterium]